MTKQFIEVDQNIRPKLEMLIEALIEILDQLDGDTDVEDGADDEPWLGSVEDARLGSTRWANSGTDDLEQEADDEPSLGSPGLRFGNENQECWAQGNSDDTEVDTDFEHDESERGICDAQAVQEYIEEYDAMERFKRNLRIKRCDSR